MKNFFKKIGASFYSGEFYNNAKKESAWVGVRFVVRVGVFVGLCLGIIGIIVFLSFSPLLKRMALGFLDNSFPNDLVVTIKDGILTANKEEPVFVPVPADKNNNESIKNITVLVPNEKTEVSVLEKYSTFSAITSNGIISQKNKNEIQIYTYPKNNQTITKDSAKEVARLVFKFGIIFLAISVIPVLLMIILGNAFCYMLAMFLIALLIWWMMKIKKQKVTYKESYKMGLRALVPALLLQIVVFPLHLSGFIFIGLVVLVIIFFSTRNWEKEEDSLKIEPIEEIKEN